MTYRCAIFGVGSNVVTPLYIYNNISVYSPRAHAHCTRRFNNVFNPRDDVRCLIQYRKTLIICRQLLLISCISRRRRRRRRRDRAFGSGAVTSNRCLHRPFTVKAYLVLV